MKNFIVNEFLEERKPSGEPYEFDSFSKVQDFMKTFKNDAYSNCYKNEPPYPYVWVRLEEITETGRDLPISYCYFATWINSSVGADLESLPQMYEYKFLLEKLEIYRNEIFEKNSILDFCNLFLLPTSQYILNKQLYLILKSGNEITKVAKRFINLFRTLDAETNDNKNQFVDTVKTILSQRQKIENNMSKINWK